jgi:DNA-binding NtrC family response regulator
MSESIGKAYTVRTLRVLLVDDEPDIRRLCGDVFEGAGYAVTPAGNARDAARAALSQPFDVAVVDYRLPDARGTALVRWLHRRFPRLAVVVFSAYADWDLFFRAGGCGARDVIAKSFSPEELLRVVRNCTGDEER